MVLTEFDEEKFELDKNNCQYNDDLIKIITPLGFAGTADYFIKTFGLDISIEELVRAFKDNMANYQMAKVQMELVNALIKTNKDLLQSAMEMATQ